MLKSFKYKLHLLFITRQKVKLFSGSNVTPGNEERASNHWSQEGSPSQAEFSQCEDPQRGHTAKLVG